MNTCPICAKPLFYAPYAPEDTAKTACSDLDCANAHGIVHQLPFDMWTKEEVEYNQQQSTEPTKGTP